MSSNLRTIVPNKEEVCSKNCNVISDIQAAGRDGQKELLQMCTLKAAVRRGNVLTARWYHGRTPYAQTYRLLRPIADLIVHKLHPPYSSWARSPGVSRAVTRRAVRELFVITHYLPFEVTNRITLSLAEDSRKKSNLDYRVSSSLATNSLAILVTLDSETTHEHLLGLPITARGQVITDYPDYGVDNVWLGRYQTPVISDTIRACMFQSWTARVSADRLTFSLSITGQTASTIKTSLMSTKRHPWKPTNIPLSVTSTHAWRPPIGRDSSGDLSREDTQLSPRPPQGQRGEDGLTAVALVYRKSTTPLHFPVATISLSPEPRVTAGARHGVVLWPGSHSSPVCLLLVTEVEETGHQG
ncbi:hypothetical protein J6590_081492 [Homalodisca vitripennis]|nr:hypothetical protein J6590_081492 [Homalodisca vitripennis]